MSDTPQACAIHLVNGQAVLADGEKSGQHHLCHECSAEYKLIWRTGFRSRKAALAWADKFGFDAIETRRFWGEWELLYACPRSNIDEVRWEGIFASHDSE